MPPLRPKPESRPLRRVVLLGVAVGLLAAVPGTGRGGVAKPPRPVVVAFAAGTRSLPAGGGFTSVFGRAAHAVRCTIAVAPALSGFPRSFGCAAPFHLRVQLPAGNPASFRITVVARGIGGTSKPRAIVLTRTGSGGGGPAPTGGNGGDAGGGTSTTGGGSTGSLPDCAAGTQLLDASPATFGEYTHIEPLGHMSGAHVLPDQADHIYFYLRPGSPSLPATVYSPGNVTLLAVTAVGHFDPATPQTVVNDYELDFSPCRSVLFWYGHVATLSPALQSALAAAPAPVCSTVAVGNQGTKQCAYTHLSLPLASGAVLGTAGGPGTAVEAFDFGAVDIRTPKLGFIDPSIPVGTMGDSYFHAVCPLDYFSDPVKSVLVGHLSSAHPGANGIPACGTTMQDRAGTIQGNWYRKGAFTAGGAGPFDFEDALAIVHSDLDQSLGVVSAGDHLFPGNGGGTQLTFTPASSGAVDREPSQVTADGHVYCYDDPSQVGGHVDVQLVDANTLQADYGSGDCPASPTLTSPTTYVR